MDGLQCTLKTLGLHSGSVRLRKEGVRRAAEVVGGYKVDRGGWGGGVKRQPY